MRWLREGQADLIAFGRKFIANPDLPERLRVGAPFTSTISTTYYSGGEKGYTDYPSLAQDRGEQPKPASTSAGGEPRQHNCTAIRECDVLRDPPWFRC